VEQGRIQPDILNFLEAGTARGSPLVEILEIRSLRGQSGHQKRTTGAQTRCCKPHEQSNHSFYSFTFHPKTGQTASRSKAAILYTYFKPYCNIVTLSEVNRTMSSTNLCVFSCSPVLIHSYVKAPQLCNGCKSDSR
jgi:hypothetical protein